MKISLLTYVFVLLSFFSFAQKNDLNHSIAPSTEKNALMETPPSLPTTSQDKPEAKKGARMPEISASHSSMIIGADTAKAEKFKQTFQVGSIIHMYAESAQNRISVAQASDPNFDNRWGRHLNIYRARILVGAQLSKKGNFFMETEIPSAIGGGNGGNGATPKNVKVSQIVLDCQYEHVFANEFSIIAGKQLISHNRNGLQGAAALMANDFTHYQYPYNLFESDPLQGNFGRDIGVNTRGFFLKDKLEYRLGMFQGRKFDNYSPYRIVGRLAYNFLDAEKDFYYAGTKLGAGKTFALAGGFDVQSTYKNYGLDAYLDVPAGPGAITVNTAFTYMTGGDKMGKYSFATLIPAQTVQFLELGYYIPTLKIQPWIKYENQHMDGSRMQYGLLENASADELKDINTINSNRRIGGGLNYFFNGYNTNLRASYTSVQYGRQSLNGRAEKDTYGQFWLQLQIFIF